MKTAPWAHRKRRERKSRERANDSAKHRREVADRARTARSRAKRQEQDVKDSTNGGTGTWESPTD